MYLLKVATQTATSYIDLVAASKALNASATASGSNAAIFKAKAPSEASSQEYADMS